MVEGGFVSVPEAARFLGLSRAKLYLLMDKQELAYAKFGKSRRIPRAALLTYAKSCMVGT
jgi:excisionase family DNA binding protein